MARMPKNQSRVASEETAVATEVVEEKAESLGGERRIVVRGRSSHGPSSFDKKAYGHWRAGFHWPATETVERAVTLREFDELAADPHLVLVYDARELEEIRAATPDDVVALDLEIEAARLEAEAATKRAQARAQRDSLEQRAENEKAAAARARLADLESQKRPRG